MGCMEEEVQDCNLRDKQFTFWRDEESVLSRRDCLGQGLALVVQASSQERGSAYLTSHSKPRAAAPSHLCLSFPTWGQDLWGIRGQVFSGATPSLPAHTRSAQQISWRPAGRWPTSAWARPYE